MHTALQFPVLGEDVLITGAGPIGLMAAAVVRHAGARYVVITDVNPYRLELARKMGVTVALDVREGSLAETQATLGMKEGFDVGLEMSGNPAALRDMVENMSHGASIAMLGLPEEPFAIDWNTVIFDQLTIRGVYGREMYETWYMMTVMLQSGLDISPVITHRFPAERFEEAFDAIRTGETGKVLLYWSDASVTSETVRSGARGRARGDPRGGAREAGARADVAAAGAGGRARPRGRGPQPVREQLPRARRPPGGDRGRARRDGGVGLRARVGALHLRDAGDPQGPRGTRSASSSGPRTRSCTRRASTRTAACSRCCSARRTR